MMKTMTTAEMQHANAGGTYYCKYRKYGCGREFTYSNSWWSKWWEKPLAKWSRDSHHSFCIFRGL